MKATKYTLTITIEVLSLDSVPGLLRKVEGELDEEVVSGSATMEDGDSVEWASVSTPVEF